MLNVIEHGFEPGQLATFDVVILRRPGQLVVAVEDQGLPFDWSRLERGAGSALATPALTAGTDDVRFVNLGTRGNRVEIVKHLPFDHIEVLIAAGGAAPVTRSASPSTAAVTVRSMKPADSSRGRARMPSTATGSDDYLYVPDRCRYAARRLLEVCVGATADYAS